MAASRNRALPILGIRQGFYFIAISVMQNVRNGSQALTRGNDFGARKANWRNFCVLLRIAQQFAASRGEQRGRHHEPERLRTLQIDYDLVVHRDWGTGSSFGLLARCGSFHSVHLGRYVPGCTPMRFGPKTGFLRWLALQPSCRSAAQSG